MAPQPSAPAPQPPPDLPSMDISDTLANYLRTFALWTRNMFGDKLDAHRALPGLMISSYGTTTQNPPVYLFGVNAAGLATLAPMALGSGAMGTPVPVGVTGVTNGSDAPAGQIGEYLTASGSVATLVTGAYAAATSLLLAPGDWDVMGQIAINTSVPSSNMQGGITTVSGGVAQQFILAGGDGVTNISLCVGPTRINVAAATRVYLNIFAIFGSGTANGSGTLRARRMR